ncbi:MAG: alpha/beta fold hydrolase [Syntrophobacteraceae bacterium]
MNTLIRARWRVSILAAVFFVLTTLPGPKIIADAGTAESKDAPRLLDRFTSFSAFPGSVSWKKTVPQVRTIRIKSSADGSLQPALYFDSGTEHKKPLLVALHSWSDNYRQRYSIPYALWAITNDWVFVHPDYRGVFSNPASTGSELSIKDILDAVDYARANARIDESRIYIVGFSGGAMTALIMAGRYPDLFTGVSAWVPVYNISRWYPYVTKFPKRRYAGQIISSCGGAPSTGSAAARECDRRSPSSYLNNARGKPVRIHISHGIRDDFVPVTHALLAFNDLAEPADRLSDDDISFIGKNARLPSHLAGSFSDKLYSAAGKRLLFRRTSGNVTLSIFSGTHDILYNPALLWLSENRVSKD